MSKLRSIQKAVPTDMVMLRGTRTGTIIRMAEADTCGANLYRLMSWLSPSYPVGAYSYSHGLEFALEDGSVTDAATTGRWITQTRLNWVADIQTPFCWQPHMPRKFLAMKQFFWMIAGLAAAFQPTSELARESQAQGRAFLDMTVKGLAM